MNKIRSYVYFLIFYISRLISISLFGICLLSVIHAKYVLSQKCSLVISYFIGLLEHGCEASTGFFFNTGLYKLVSFNTFIDLYINFCKNSQRIDLLLITLAIVLILSIIIIKFVNKEYRYLLTVGIISSTIYLVTYSIFKLPVMLALTISTPIILTIIYFLNRICPIQKVIMLVPIIGEIFCIKSIIKYISNKTSDKILNIFLLITALILSNIICFLFPYKTNKDFENLIMNNDTYSIRIYQDKMIISCGPDGGPNLIHIDMDKTINKLYDNNFEWIEDFIINKAKQEIYMYNISESYFIILDAINFNLKNKVNVVKNKNNQDTARICCNSDFSKVIFIMESKKLSVLMDLNTYNIKNIKRTSPLKDGLIYNKYRNCFLVSFYIEVPFLQEIDIENKKIRKIKAAKYQGYLAISERNKEIYVAFNQQGRIGVYDAETMKLKRKIKSNYAVRSITYDEELNILIAPSYFTGYVDIFLMDGSDKLLTREFVGYDLREGCFDPQKENLYVCSVNGLYKKKIDIRKLIEECSNVSHETKN